MNVACEEEAGRVAWLKRLRGRRHWALDDIEQLVLEADAAGRARPRVRAGSRAASHASRALACTVERARRRRRIAGHERRILCERVRRATRLAVVDLAVHCTTTHDGREPRDRHRASRRRRGVGQRGPRRRTIRGADADGTRTRHRVVVLLIPGAVKVYLARDPIDMRRSFEGLSNVVKYVLGRDPLSGHVFVFLNRLRTHMKMLVWTHGGFTIVYKRLEAGEFALPRDLTSAGDSLEIDMRALSLLLEGIDVRHVRTRKRWVPPTHPSTSQTSDGSACKIV